MKRKDIIIDFIVENPNFYRIVWKSLTEDSSGVGAYADNEQDAMCSARELNKAYPECHHWVEPNPGLN